MATLLTLIFKKLNQQIQKQWAFFGPKWWCWLLVGLGSIPWFIEGPFKAFGYAKYGPGYQTMNYIHSVLINGDHLYFFILIDIFCVPCMGAMIYFPSFMFLLSRVIVEYYKPSSVKKYYLMYFGTLTSPLWFDLIIWNIPKIMG